MKNTFPLQQIYRASTLDTSLKSRQNQLNLMADFMRIKYENFKLEQTDIANQLDYPTSILQRYRNYIHMLSPYRIQTNTTSKRIKKRLQILHLTPTQIANMTSKTSNDFK